MLLGLSMTGKFIVTHLRVNKLFLQVATDKVYNRDIHSLLIK